MNLKNNQFLKIKVLHTNWLDFEIYEIPAEKWKRPRRYHLQIPMMNLVNRHKKESKMRLINESLTFVQRGFLDTFYPPKYFTNCFGNDLG